MNSKSPLATRCCQSRVHPHPTAQVGHPQTACGDNCCMICLPRTRARRWSRVSMRICSSTVDRCSSVPVPSVGKCGMEAGWGARTASVAASAAASNTFEVERREVAVAERGEVALANPMNGGAGGACGKAVPAVGATAASGGAPGCGTGSPHRACTPPSGAIPPELRMAAVAGGSAASVGIVGWEGAGGGDGGGGGGTGGGCSITAGREGCAEEKAFVGPAAADWWACCLRACRAA